MWTDVCPRWFSSIVMTVATPMNVFVIMQHCPVFFPIVYMTGIISKFEPCFAVSVPNALLEMILNHSHLTTLSATMQGGQIWVRTCVCLNQPGGDACVSGT
jgi:hypothetical protein